MDTDILWKQLAYRVRKKIIFHFTRIPNDERDYLPSIPIHANVLPMFPSISIQEYVASIKILWLSRAMEVLLCINKTKNVTANLLCSRYLQGKNYAYTIFRAVTSKSALKSIIILYTARYVNKTTVVQKRSREVNLQNACASKILINYYLSL